MTELIIDKVVEELKSLEYITRIGGIVTPIKMKKGDQTFTIPAIRNTEPSECQPDDYIDFVPDSKETVMLWFEERGALSIEDEASKWYNVRHDLRLMTWINSKLFGEETYKLKYQIMKTVPRMIDNINPLSIIIISLAGLPEKTPALFEKYGFETTKSQYLIYPYDYFAIDYTVKYRMPMSCELELNRNPEEC